MQTVKTFPFVVELSYAMVFNYRIFLNVVNAMCYNHENRVETRCRLVSDLFVDLSEINL